jgi:hypothetical protein
MAALLAITAWITLGLILTAIAWALSRWLGKATVPGIRSGGCASEDIGHRRRQANSRTMSLDRTHDRTAL